LARIVIVITHLPGRPARAHFQPTFRGAFRRSPSPSRGKGGRGCTGAMGEVCGSSERGARGLRQPLHEGQVWQRGGNVPGSPDDMRGGWREARRPARGCMSVHGADGLTAWAPPERPPVRPLVALPRQKPTVILTQISWRARSRGSVAQPGRRGRSIRAALLAAILAGWLRLGRAGVNHGAVVRTAAFFGTGQPFLREPVLAKRSASI